MILSGTGIRFEALFETFAGYSAPLHVLSILVFVAVPIHGSHGITAEFWMCFQGT